MLAPPPRQAETENKTGCGSDACNPRTWEEKNRRITVTWICLLRPWRFFTKYKNKKLNEKISKYIKNNETDIWVPSIQRTVENNQEYNGLATRS